MLHGARVVAAMTILARAAAPAAAAPRPGSQVVITGTCGESGFVGEVSAGSTVARFRSCVAGGVARATFMDAGGDILAEYEVAVSGKDASTFRIGGAAFAADGEMPEQAKARLLELLRLPSAPLLAGLPGSLLDLGFCEERPAVAAVLGLAFLFGGSD